MTGLGVDVDDPKGLESPEPHKPNRYALNGEVSAFSATAKSDSKLVKPEVDRDDPLRSTTSTALYQHVHQSSVSPLANGRNGVEEEFKEHPVNFETNKRRATEMNKKNQENLEGIELQERDRFGTRYGTMKSGTNMANVDVTKSMLDKHSEKKGIENVTTAGMSTVS